MSSYIDVRVAYALKRAFPILKSKKIVNVVVVVILKVSPVLCIENAHDIEVFFL